MSAVDFPFVDSAAHLNTAQVDRKWTQGVNAITASGGRNGGPYYTGSVFGLSRTFLNEVQSVVVGMAIMYPTAFQGSNDLIVMANLSQPVGITFPIRIANDGRVHVLDSSGGVWNSVNFTLAGFTAHIGVWYFVEYKLTLGTTVVSSSGHPTISYEVYIDNVLIGSGTVTSTNTNAGLSFPNTGPTFAQVTIGTGGIDFCDIYMTDGEVLNDGVAQSFFTRQDGTYTAGVPSSAGAHYLMTKEHTADDAATTVVLANVADKDSSLMDVVSGYQTIKAVQFLWCANKPQAGVSSFEGLLKSGGSEVNTQEFFPNESFFYHRLGYRKSPHTTLDYTQTELNAQEVGAVRIS